MNRNTPLHLLVILTAVALAGYFLYPSFMYYSKTPVQRREYLRENPKILGKIFNLGLDLQGGMRMVLEVDRDAVKEEGQKDLLDRAYTVIENRINGLGVAEPTIQKQGRDRLIIELPGLSNEQEAKEVIGKTAQLEFRVVRTDTELERAIRIIDRAAKGIEEQDTVAAPGEKKEETAMEGDDLFGTGASTTADSVEETDDEGVLAGKKSFKDYLVGLSGGMVGVQFDDIHRVNAILESEKVQQAMARQARDNAFLWGHDTITVDKRPYRELYYVKAEPEMTGADITEARSDLDNSAQSGPYLIRLEFNKKGGRDFARVTGRNRDRFLAIVLDSTVYSAPRIQERIALGTAQITGSFSRGEAHSLAVVLRAGALPAPVNIREERIVGPTLGQDSIKKGMYSSLIGFGLVVVFMVIYYGFSGIIANIALFLNLVFVLSIMASLNATLTLPGIAGLILLIGMAVDANVIIFERIREELLLGKTVRSAITAGYSRAYLTIMDANITTLITAFILLKIGTGPIKGFAITLIIGIIISLITSLYITRVFFTAMTANKKNNKLSI